MQFAAARRIDQEVTNIISGAYEKTKQMILDNRDKLEKIANYLLERESLSSNEIDDILKGNDLKPVTNSEKDKNKQDREKSGNNKDTDSETVTGETGKAPGPPKEQQVFKDRIARE